MKTLHVWIGLGLAALAQAAVVRPAPAQQPQPQRLPPAVTRDTFANAVIVQNQRSTPVTIYADYGKFDRRLGVVPARGDATLSLPKWAVEGRHTIRLFAHAEGEVTDMSTREFALRPPARIGMVVPTRDVMMTASRDTMMTVIPPDALDDATLTVDNPRAVPVTVFANPGQYDVRLGEVPARSRLTLRFPTSVLGPGRTLRVFVHPEGGPDLSSQFMKVGLGQHLGLRVPPR